ncbi:MAG TPA: KTSC domain-containing protein [Candidatus Acidoferrum sp.]
MTIYTESFVSEAVASATYDDETQQLEVTFTSGSTYTLAKPVPPAVWDAFKDAPSPGRFWHTVLKGAYT